MNDRKVILYNNQNNKKMKTEKKTYEEPTVQKVEFDFKNRIAFASGCTTFGASVCSES